MQLWRKEILEYKDKDTNRLCTTKRIVGERAPSMNNTQTTCRIYPADPRRNDVKERLIINSVKKRPKLLLSLKSFRAS